MKKLLFLVEASSRKFRVDIGVFIVFFLVTLIFVISIVHTL